MVMTPVHQIWPKPSCKTRQTEEEVGRQHQGLDRPGVRQVPEGSGEQGKKEEICCEIICGAPTTLAVKGWMMMMMMMMMRLVLAEGFNQLPALRALKAHIGLQMKHLTKIILITTV